MKTKEQIEAKLTETLIEYNQNENKDSGWKLDIATKSRAQREILEWILAD